MDLKYIFLVIGLILLIGTASAAGEPTNVGIDVPYEKTLTNTPMWFRGTADGATSWFWDFGDEETSTAQNVQHAFTDEGEYFVTLTATNIHGYTTIGRTITANTNALPPNGEHWNQVTDHAGWTARHGHTSVVYDGKMWVMGGYGSSPTYKNDVWWSTDGITWTQATASAGWGARREHTSVVYDGKMWVMGGFDGSRKNDVWWSTNGITWTRATASAGWSARYGHTSVVYDGKMWVMGGTDTGYLRDVWWSTDGVTWTQATAAAAWSARQEPTSVVHDGKMWIIGGYGDRSVWWSTDGVAWTQATAVAAWPGRYGLTSLAVDDKIWVMGGADGGVRYNDVWWSTDGATWTRATAMAEWFGRFGHTSVVHDGKMWVMGGDGFSGVTIHGNDVWASDNDDTAIQHSSSVIQDVPITFSTPISSYNVAFYQWQFGDGQTATGANPIHTYAESGTYTVTLTIPDEVNGLQTTYTKPITVAAGEGLTAGFTTSQRSGTPPLTVQFVDTSTGNPTAWAWNFGDGSATSNTRNPSHTYASIGSYTVSLYVENAEDSDWEVKTNYITVSSFPPIIASPTYNTTIHYDMANGTYLQYWLFNVTTFGDIPVYGFAYGIMAPLMNVWGYWVFVMFWLAYLFIVWIRTSDIGLPIIIGLLTAGVWGLFFPPEAMQFAYLMFGLSIAALLTKLAIEYI